MSYELKPYQSAAVYDEADGLLANTLRFLKSQRHQRLFVLKSIMGSGKTIIASEFIEAVLNSTDSARIKKELCVIWLSKGNAGLHMQSSAKLDMAIRDKTIHIYGIRDSADFNADRFYDKDVYVINWEKINNLKNGELVNNLFVDSEMKNLRSAKRNSPDVEYIFIIDEFHMNYGTDSYRQIIQFFDPIVIIGMSATPYDAQMAKADARYVIPVTDVIKEGMVKKGVCFNTATDYTDDEISEYDTIDEFFLRLSLRQRDILERKFRSADSSVIPLLLIQFNDDKTNEDIIKVKEILDREYDNNREDTYAIWISDSDNKKDRLRSPEHIIRNLDNNNVRILLFKQAVATGWDCPRAHVLLRYRRVAKRKDANATSVFDIQTLGRIFRMPEPYRFIGRTYKHYDDDELNYGYVYIPNNAYVLEKDFRQAFGNYADMFGQSTVTVDFSAESTQTTIETPPSDAGTAQDDNKQPTPYEQMDSDTLKQPVLPLAGVSTGQLSLDDMRTPAQLSTPPEGGPQIQPEMQTAPKTSAQEYAELYGAAIRTAEVILSSVNVIASDRRPECTDINRAVKDILKDITIQCDIRRNGSYAGQQLTFYGKTMEINDALFEEDTVTMEDSGTVFSVNDTPSDLDDKAKKLLGDIIDRKLYPKATKDYLKKKITQFFRKTIADLDEVDEIASAETSKLILLNVSVIKKIVRELDDKIRQMSLYEFTVAPFKFPTTFRLPPEADPASKGLLHLPLPRTASGPEQVFERVLNSNGNDVLLWYKNPDHGANAFCVKYIQRHQLRGRTVETNVPTYPDFIVIFKDGCVGMYEIKDYDKQDVNDSLKALAISETVSVLIKNGYSARGGLVYIDQQSEQIRNAEKYPEL